MLKSLKSVVISAAVLISLSACSSENIPTPENIINANSTILDEGVFRATADIDITSDYTGDILVDAEANIETKDGLGHITADADYKAGDYLDDRLTSDIYIDYPNSTLYSYDAENDKWLTYTATADEAVSTIVVDPSKITVDMFDDLSVKVKDGCYVVSGSAEIAKLSAIFPDADITSLTEKLGGISLRATMKFDTETLKLQSLSLTLPDAAKTVVSVLGFKVNAFEILFETLSDESEGITLPTEDETEEKEEIPEETETEETETADDNAEYDDNQMYEINQFEYDIDGNVIQLPMTAQLIVNYGISEFDTDVTVSGNSDVNITSDDESVTLRISNTKTIDRSAPACKVTGIYLNERETAHTFAFYGITEKSVYDDFEEIFGAPAYRLETGAGVIARWRFTGGEFTVTFSADGTISEFDVEYNAY